MAENTKLTDGGWDMNGGAAQNLLLSRLAGQEASWDRLLNRISATLAIAFATAGAGIAVLVSRGTKPTDDQWILLCVVSSLTMGIAFVGILRFWSRPLKAGPDPEHVGNWVAWSGAQADWFRVLCEAVTDNRSLLQTQRWWSNLLLVLLLFQIAAVGLLAVVVIRALPSV